MIIKRWPFRVQRLFSAGNEVRLEYYADGQDSRRPQGIRTYRTSSLRRKLIIITAAARDETSR